MHDGEEKRPSGVRGDAPRGEEFEAVLRTWDRRRNAAERSRGRRIASAVPGGGMEDCRAGRATAPRAVGGMYRFVG